MTRLHARTRGEAVTPEPIPDFDLYEELEVSPKASSRTIEAAYRSLLKTYHPDVAGAAPEVIEKAKRLNIARDWLTDRDRRATYDRARAQATPAAAATTTAATAAHAAASAPPPQPSGAAPGGSAAGAGAASGAAGRQASRSSAMRDAGPKENADALTVFLGDIGSLRSDRARRIAARAADAGVATRSTGPYETATAAVAQAGMNTRTGAWTHARAAARRAVNEQVGLDPAARSVSRVAADLAGAIVVRDLVLPQQYATIRDVWTGDKTAAAASRGGASARRASQPPGAGSAGGAAPSELSLSNPAVLIAAIVGIVAVAAVLLLVLLPR